MAKQVFRHTRLSRAYLALARLSCCKKVDRHNVESEVSVLVQYILQVLFQNYIR